jgi:hypothetical protein
MAHRPNMSHKKIVNLPAGNDSKAADKQSNAEEKERVERKPNCLDLVFLL